MADYYRSLNRNGLGTLKFIYFVPLLLFTFFYSQVIRLHEQVCYSFLNKITNSIWHSFVVLYIFLNCWMYGYKNYLNSLFLQQNVGTRVKVFAHYTHMFKSHFYQLFLAKFTNFGQQDIFVPPSTLSKVCLGTRWSRIFS